MTSSELIKELNEIIRRNGFTIKRMAEEIGVPHKNLASQLSHGDNIHIDRLIAILSAVKYKLWMIYGGKAFCCSSPDWVIQMFDLYRCNKFLTLEEFCKQCGIKQTRYLGFVENPSVLSIKTILSMIDSCDHEIKIEMAPDDFEFVSEESCI